MRKFWLKSLIATGLLLSSLASVALAATPNDVGEGLQISPTAINLTADKGGAYPIKLKVTNVTPGTLNVKGTIDDFNVKDESGAPKILEGTEDTLGPNFSFKSWTKQIGDMQLKPHETKEVTVSVNIPNSAEAGGHYGIIRFTGRPPELADQNVSLSASIGSLVLVRVAGNITEKLAIKEFYIAQNDKKKSFVETGPLKLVTRFENTGNIHVKPSGIITVKNMFGKTVASLQISDIPGNVLPQSIRKFEQTFKNKWLFGKYTATVNATYGIDNNNLSSTITFWAFPYRPIIMIVLSLAALIVGLRKLIKGYNARIIKKHSNTKQK